jgi:hypothetical protein
VTVGKRRKRGSDSTGSATRRPWQKYGKNYIWRQLAKRGCVPKYQGDDRNAWWQKYFDNYRFLPARAANASEVGCGPYTIMRFIQEACQPDHLFLSDPLIRT